MTDHAPVPASRPILYQFTLTITGLLAAYVSYWLVLTIIGPMELLPDTNWGRRWETFYTHHPKPLILYTTAFGMALIVTGFVFLLRRSRIAAGFLPLGILLERVDFFTSSGDAIVFSGDTTLLAYASLSLELAVLLAVFYLAIRGGLR